MEGFTDRFTMDAPPRLDHVPRHRWQGVNPKKMKQMMKQMGISIEEIEGVEEVIIRTADREIFFLDASVTVMDAQGEQVVPGGGHRPGEAPRDIDPRLRRRAGGGPDRLHPQEAKAALKEASGDLAEAIVKLGSS